jgi:hypothetical protein
MPSPTASPAAPPSSPPRTPPPTSSTAASSSTNTNPPNDQARIEFDIVDAHRALATLGLHYQRLSRQFQKTLDTIREIQSERRHQQERHLKRAAALLQLHKHKGVPYDPAQDGFVFSNDEIEAFSQRLMRLNQSRHIEHVLFHMQPPAPAPVAHAPTRAAFTLV